MAFNPSLISCLPEEIMLNIISRLPVDSILECRRVFKTWRNLLSLRGGINTNHFADMHLHNNNNNNNNNNTNNNSSDSETDNKLSLVFLGGSAIKKWLYYVEYDENDVQSYSKYKRFKLPIPADAKSLVGSCNGLICLAVRSKSYSYDPIYICNPITREFVHLPRFIMNDNITSCYIAHGFGYIPSTNEYKVVRVYYYSHLGQYVGQVQVYTLGSGIGWRNKGEVNLPLLATMITSPGVFLNGAIHWRTAEANIVAFDLAEEEFRCIPLPFLCGDSRVCMLGGWLCVVRQDFKFDMEIWLFKKNEKQSASNDIDDYMEEAEEHQYQFWSWSRELTMKMNDLYLTLHPISITKGGEILLLRNGATIVCYDPKTAAPKDIVELHRAMKGNHAISHFNSLVSLKALGENAEIL